MKKEENDPFDDFFDNLAEIPQRRTPGDFSDDTSSEDPEVKARSFVNPESNEKDEEIKTLDENEPEYILPPDHTKIAYPNLKRCILTDDLKCYLDSIDNKDVEKFFISNDVLTQNSEIKPMLSFEPIIDKISGFDDFLKELKVENPTPVQAQSIPIALSGQNLIVVSPTGTGKTLCFLIPLVLHVLSCLETKENDKFNGPLGLIISPTEMLSHQTALVLNKLIRKTKIQAVEITGGNLKFKQENSIIKGADIITATPGRLIKFLQQVDWRYCNFLVVDEADKIFESGFFRQLRSIFDYMRPDKQILLFGATLPPQIEELSRNSLKYSARIQIGRTGAPQQNIEHNFIFFDTPKQKKIWIKDNIQKFKDGLVLIFVKDIKFCEALFNELKSCSELIGFVHGQLNKQKRDEVFNKFKNQKIRFLISTEIAARGIDINGINTVVNYDIPEKTQNYIHRVGRTARAGRSGVAYTLMTPRDALFAVELLQHFLKCGIEPPENLIDFVNNYQNDPKAKNSATFDFDF